MINLQNRLQQKEQLDNFDLNIQTLHQVLKELELINTWFGNTRSLIKAIQKIITTQKLSKITIVDLGCGGGDVLRNVTKALPKLNVTCIGIDGNSNTIAYAQEKSSPYPQISYQVCDIFDSNFKLPKCDILLSSHFVYHFKDIQLSKFIDENSQHVKIAFLFSELERSKIAYYIFKITTPLFRFNKITKEDGLLALRRAFSKKELVKIAADIIGKNYKIQRKWAFRFLLSIAPKIKQNKI